MTDIQVEAVLNARIEKILPKGAIVKLGKKTAFLHISELSEKYVKNVEDEVRVGQELEVRVIKVEKDKIFVSLKGIMSEEMKLKEFEDKLQNFLKDSKETQMAIQKSKDKKRGTHKRNGK